MQQDDADPRLAIGPRIGAAVIDLVLLGVLFLVLSILFGGNRSTTTHTGTTRAASASFQLSGGAFLLFLVLTFAYYIVSEALYGRTLGKQLLGLRVIKLSGEPCGWAAALGRNLLRLVDGLPLLYLVGFISMLASKRAQRLGDQAAGTVVVRKPSGAN